MRAALRLSVGHFSKLSKNQNFFGWTPAFSILWLIHRFLTEPPQGLPNASRQGGAVLKTLLDAGTSLKRRDRRRRCLLHIIAGQGWGQLLEIVANCSQKQLRPFDLRDDHGATPLHYAAYSNSPETVTVLLRQGCNVNVKDKAGRTALDIARLFGFASVERLFALSATGSSHSFFPREPRGEMQEIHRRDFLQYVTQWMVHDTFEATCDLLLASPSLGRLEYQSKEVKAEAHFIIREMQRFIANIMTEVYKELGEKHVEVVLRGSIAEGTRSGPPAEFDFMLISEHSVLPKEIFRLIVKQHSLFIQTPFDFIRCVEEHPRTKLEVLFCGNIYKHLVISVDLVPAQRKQARSVYGCYDWKCVRFDGCNEYEVGSNTSFTEYEERLMASLPKVAVDCYILMKAFRSPLVHGMYIKSYRDNVLSSYELKHSLFFCYGEFLKQAPKVDSGLQLKQSRRDWMEAMLESLKREIKLYEYPLMSTSRREDLKKPCSYRLKCSADST
jgi:hypothetical protein